MRKSKVEVLQNAVVQMVRIGNKVNWNEPIDKDYVDALNELRGLLQSAQHRVHQTAGGRGSKKSKLVVPAAGNA